MFPRALLIVMDSVGAGALPDASLYGDEGSDTLGNIARAVGLKIPTLRSLGLGMVARIGVPGGSPRGAFGRMAERSAGKDSVTGHWEMMGIVLDRPFPTFPQGFPPDVIQTFEARIGRGTLGNTAASGTAIIDSLVAMSAAQANRAVAEVRSAIDLSDDQRTRLAAAIESATGKQVELKVIVDPTILGGIVTTVGDTVLDGSVRTRLERLKQQF